MITYKYSIVYIAGFCHLTVSQSKVRTDALLPPSPNNTFQVRAIFVP